MYNEFLEFLRRFDNNNYLRDSINVRNPIIIRVTIIGIKRSRILVPAFFIPSKITAE